MINPSPPLPRPDVITTHKEESSTHQIDITISRDNKGKTYTGKGHTPTDAITDAVKQIINTSTTAEWLP